MTEFDRVQGDGPAWSGDAPIEAGNERVATADPDKPSILPHLAPPSAEEAKLFYFGLPSLPRLVGRASAGVHLWEPPPEHIARQPEASGSRLAKSKVLGQVGRHNILSLWWHVRPFILTSISHLPWSSIDVCRIGDADVAPLDRPVVVWIGVDRGTGDKQSSQSSQSSLPWAEVAHVLRSCRRILDSAGLADVDCQLRESRVELLAGPPLLKPPAQASTPWQRIAQHFTTAVGQGIYSMDEPSREGTLGVYLSTAGANANTWGRPLYAVTCRHVGMPSKDSSDDNERYHRRNDTRERQVGLNMPSKVRRWIASLAQYAEEQSGSPAASDVARICEVVKDFEPDNARAIGHVLMCPPFGQGFSPFAWTRDWCILALDQSKFSGGACPTNAVDLRTEMPPLAAEQLLNPDPQSPNKFKFPEDGLLRISGIVPLSEIRNRSARSRDAGDGCCFVGKRGAATGLTWGCPLELKSTVQRCMPGQATSLMSQEWAIYSAMPDRTDSFSAAGDSGAVVFDTRGRLGGFLTSGASCDAGRGVDITYTTPAELVLADIEAHLGHKVVLL